MSDHLEFSIQPYKCGVTDGPEIKVKAATPIGAVKAALKEKTSFRGRFGQLRAYVTYFDDGKSHRVRCYSLIAE
jgi:hypothetical protein